VSASGRGSVYRDGGAYYTPAQLAEGIVREVVVRHVLPNLRPEARTCPHVLEPSAGGAAFVRAVRRNLPRAHLVAMDVDPQAPVLALPWRWRFKAKAQDFLRLFRERCLCGHGLGSHLTSNGETRDCVNCECRGWRDHPITEPIHPAPATDLVVGNPPFGIPPDQARELYPELEVPATRIKSPVPMAERHVRQAAALVAGRGSVVFLLRLAFLESQERRALWRELPPRKVWTVVPRPGFLQTSGNTDSTAYGVFWWDRLNPQLREPPGWLDWETGTTWG
jgi:hypothetical protein